MAATENEAGSIEEALSPLLEENSETDDVNDGSGLCRCCQRASKALKSVANSYHRLLESRPLITKSVTAFFILGAADLVGQGVQGQHTWGKVDVLRTLRFAIFGLVLQAPWNHYYYLALDGTLPPTEYPWTRRTFVKVIIDQFIQAPIFTVLIFVFLGAEQGNGVQAIWSQIKQEYWRTMFANCKSSVHAFLHNGMLLTRCTTF